MNPTLASWNGLPFAEALPAALACCGATRWAAALTEGRPYFTPEAVFVKADELWKSTEAQDWLEAFACHPRIGESAGERHTAWSTEEQSAVKNAEPAALEIIAQKNAEYERRHGFTYIVCATGKSAEELLDILEARLHNSTEIELREAAEQQRQILQLRLRKWLNT